MRKFSRSVCGLAVMFLGCNPVLDGKKLEEAISSKLKADKYPLTSVSCPADQPMQKDATLVCTAKFEGDVTVSVDVKQTGEGNVEWDAKGILLVADFVKVVDKKTKEADPKAEVTCPGNKPVIVVKKDVTLACSVKSEGGTQQYQITFKDDKGDWDAKVVGGAAAPAAEKQATAPEGAPSAAPDADPAE